MIATKCHNPQRLIDHLMKELNLKTLRQLAVILSIDNSRLTKAIKNCELSYYIIVQCMRALPKLSLGDIEALADIEYEDKKTHSTLILGKKKFLLDKPSPFDALLL